MSETPVTQEFVTRLILKIVGWLVFLALVGLVAFWLWGNISGTSAIMDKSSESNARAVGR